VIVLACIVTAVVVWALVGFFGWRRISGIARPGREQALDFELQVAPWSDKHVESLLAGNPDSPTLLRRYAEIALQREDWSEAVRRAELFTARAPQSPYSWTTRVRVLQCSSRVEEALAVLRQAVRRLPKDPEVLVAWAYEAYGRQDWQEAVRRFARVRRVAVRVDCYQAAADALVADGQPDEAEALIAEGLRKQPDDWMMWHAAALIAARLGKHDEAIGYWETMRNRFPHEPTGYLFAADALREVGRSAEALDLIEQAHDFFPINKDIESMAIRLRAPVETVGPASFSQASEEDRGSLAMKIDFRSGGNSEEFKVTGWSLPEPAGTWAIGDESRLAFLVRDSEGESDIRITLAPNVSPPAIAVQRLRVLLNDVEIFSATPGEGWSVLHCPVPRELLYPHATNELRLVHPDAFIPAILGISDDSRRLSLLVGEIEFGGTLAGQVTSLPGEDNSGHATAAVDVGAQRPPVIHVVTQGRLGNQIIQWFAALKIQSLVPDSLLSNIKFPEWGIEIPSIPPTGSIIYEADPHHIDLAGTVRRLTEEEFKRVELSGFCQRMEYFLPVDKYRTILGPPASGIRRIGADALLISVRGGEIINPIAPSYTLIPTDFYKHLISETGLRPVFMGQLEHNIYTDHLRSEFPQAEFIASQGPDIDFEIIRAASNVVPSVSTFAWAAAWLSRADRIFFPVTGFYNPMQEPRINLLPRDDQRYSFFLFPANYAVDPQDVVDAHQSIAPFIRQMPLDMIETLVHDRPRFPRKLADYLAIFDEERYLGNFPDVRDALERGLFSSAVEHYERIGFERNFLPFRFDTTWYVKSYPLAALEVGQGDFLDLPHHYAAVGRLRGHLPASA
jgi:tetratricopeptide (TPR) repeat protein